MKYLITVEQRVYGNIQVEANDREEAKKLAVQLAKDVDWFDDKAYQVVEVYRLEEGNEQ